MDEAGLQGIWYPVDQATLEGDLHAIFKIVPKETAVVTTAQW
jgi:hypothetical protein